MTLNRDTFGTEKEMDRLEYEYAEVFGTHTDNNPNSIKNQNLVKQTCNS